MTHLYIVAQSPLRPTFWQHKWAERAKVQYRSMLRLNWLMGLHELVDPNEPAERIDRTEAAKYGLGTARSAAAYWDWAGVKPGPAGAGLPEWSVNNCATYEAGGMPYVPVDEDDSKSRR